MRFWAIFLTLVRPIDLILQILIELNVLQHSARLPVPLSLSISAHEGGQPDRIRIYSSNVTRAQVTSVALLGSRWWTASQGEGPDRIRRS